MISAPHHYDKTCVGLLGLLLALEPFEVNVDFSLNRSKIMVTTKAKNDIFRTELPCGQSWMMAAGYDGGKTELA